MSHNKSVLASSLDAGTLVRTDAFAGGIGGAAGRLAVTTGNGSSVRLIGKPIPGWSTFASQVHPVTLNTRDYPSKGERVVAQLAYVYDDRDGKNNRRRLWVTGTSDGLDVIDVDDDCYMPADEGRGQRVIRRSWALVDTAADVKPGPWKTGRNLTDDEFTEGTVLDVTVEFARAKGATYFQIGCLDMTPAELDKQSDEATITKQTATVTGRVTVVKPAGHVPHVIVTDAHGDERRFTRRDLAANVARYRVVSPGKPANDGYPTAADFPTDGLWFDQDPATAEYFVWKHGGKIGVLSVRTGHGSTLESRDERIRGRKFKTGADFGWLTSYVYKNKAA